MSEFTGERVIPGQVEIDLWNEHFSRYAFAAAFAVGKRVLDLGCGAGYGSADLGKVAASVMGVDVSADAVNYAREHYGSTSVYFETASCTALPWHAVQFDCIVAFEVIEHLQNWTGLLSEARRLLAPGGVFLVSTPNKRYYAEHREQAGPNPYHVHEFEYGEFQAALTEYFPGVHLLLQNRTEAFSFAGPGPGPNDASNGRLALHAESAPESAHFFLAVCGLEAAPAPFVYVPSSANLLRDRELHIARLASEVSLKTNWLSDMTRQRDLLQSEHNSVVAHLEERNHWAQSLESELEETRKRVVQLQEEFSKEQLSARETSAAYESKIAELEEDLRQKTAWATGTETRLSAELQAKCNELAEAVRLLDKAEADLEERTKWALSLDAQLKMIRDSRWVRVGRIVGVGPKLD